ncbi:MAG TPA: hypothetical protein EYQ24_01450 [Bacteroidetes bacterium]|nr:hypothetical protein [Bacteroidota bacterium]
MLPFYLPSRSRPGLLLAVCASLLLALPVQAQDYDRTANAALSGHNTKTLSGVSVQQCQAACTAETEFVCRSFDYRKNENTCDLSDTTADAAGGLKTDYAGDPYDHYERVFFRHTPNAALPGNNNVQLESVTVEQCQAACEDETGFTCRSFDYYKNENKCDLSDMTADAAGGLKTDYAGDPYDHYERVIPAASTGSKRFDQYTWLTSHNAYANLSEGWTMAAQSYGITTQLNDGVRGLMLDVHDFDGSHGVTCVASFGSDCYDPGVYLCHGSCTGLPGMNYALPRRRLHEVLNEIGAWVRANPGEENIVTLFLESGARTDGVFDEMRRSTQLLPYIYNPGGTAWNVPSRGWPPLEWMNDNNKRVVIFSDMNYRPNDWMVFNKAYTRENYWSLGDEGTNMECRTRWDDRPLDSFGLFVMNHFRNAPTTITAAIDNRESKLKERWTDYCSPASGGTIPNYLAVDFVEVGSAQQIVDEFNRADRSSVSQAPYVESYTSYVQDAKAAVNASCESDSDCANGACGRSHANNAPLLCCPSGSTVNHAGYDYCTGMPDGTACWLDSMCANDSCSGNLYGAQRGTCD